MSTNTPAFTPQLFAYLQQVNLPEHPVLAEIRTHTATHRLGNMAIAPEQAALLTWLAQVIRAKNYLEIGVFTGYSSTAMALALPEDGQLSCCDINISFTDIAQEYWQKAGVSHKIKLYVQPALITLETLISSGHSNHYDMALIDADKPSIPHYYERCLALVRSGGIIAIDNVLLNGRIIQNSDNLSHHTVRAFNAALAQDTRILPITLALGDGLTLLLKK